LISFFCLLTTGERANVLPNRNAQEINGLGERRESVFGRSSPLVVVLGQESQILDLAHDLMLVLGMGEALGVGFRTQKHGSN
jgi:hypothetical protein